MKKLISLILSAVAAFTALSACVFADAETDELSRYLSESFESFSSEIDISSFNNKYGWNKSRALDVITAAYYSHPEFFFVKNEFLYAVYDDKVQSIRFEYVFRKEQLDSARKLLDSAAKEIVAGVTEDMDDVAKALYVHDYIILHCSYDNSTSKYSAYDCLIDRSCVCQGYTLAYEYILNNYLGIDCTAVYSNSENHIWNYVKIDGNWYHVDLTLDDMRDSYGGKSYDRYGSVLHENFLMSDKRCRDVSDLHRNWVVAGEYPSAADNGYDNAFWTDIRTQICFFNGNYYYTENNGKDDKGKRITDLCRFSPDTQKKTVLARLKCSWNVTRSSTGEMVPVYGTRSYMDVFSCPVYRNGKIYFNSNKSVYSYNISTKKLKKLYTLDKGEAEQIYGMVGIDGGLRISYRKDLTYDEKYIKLMLK